MFNVVNNMEKKATCAACTQIPKQIHDDEIIFFFKKGFLFAKSFIPLSFCHIIFLMVTSQASLSLVLFCVFT